MTTPLPTDLKSRIQASYNAIAPTYNEWTTSHSSTKLHYLSLLLSHLNLSAKNSDSNSDSTPISILELGCGNGLPVTQKLLENPSINVTANDLSSTQLSLAQENLSTFSNPNSNPNDTNRLNFLQGDMHTLTFPPSTFHAVIGIYSLIHLPRTEQILMLQKISGWLKPGGFLLANFSVLESEGCEMEKWLDEEKGWMFWSGWGAEGTLERIKGLGLSVVVREEVVDRDGGGEGEGDVRFLWVLARK